MRCASSGIEPERADRSCGFLTETERKHLLGEYDGDSTKKNSDIRVRTRHALADLYLLEEYGDQELKDTIIKEDLEVDIFRERELKHLTDGVLKLAFTLSAGEEFGEEMFEAIQSDIDIEAAVELADAAMKGNRDKVVSLTKQMV